MEGLGVEREVLNLAPSGYSQQWLADQVSNKLFDLVLGRGVHPGHCAILFNQDMESSLFPLGTSAFLQGVNDAMKGRVARSQARHVLQLTQDMEESVLYGESHTKSQAADLLTNSPALGEQTIEFQCERHHEVSYMLVT